MTVQSFENGLDPLLVFRKQFSEGKSVSAVDDHRFDRMETNALKLLYS